MPKLTLRDLFAVVTIVAVLAVVAGVGVAIAPWINRVNSVEVQDRRIVFETSPDGHPKPVKTSISFGNAAIFGVVVALPLAVVVAILLWAITNLRQP